MKVFVFTSDCLTNVWAAVGAQLWAVPKSKSDSSNKGRRTKAGKMPIRAFGLLYCSADKTFTTPFVVQAQAVDTSISHIWPGDWILPFVIRTLGTPHKRLSWADASSQMPSCVAGTPLHKLLHVEPLTVFTGDEVTDADWSFLIKNLTP